VAYYHNDTSGMTQSQIWVGCTAKDCLISSAGQTEGACTLAEGLILMLVSLLHP